ncbi:hypothetical protein, partial [Enterobacter hormaechei]|uniref:hypothetical protein n=1 Tax=Enterobacter hormaechei TaxID=158836 RepID=UPI0023E40C26
KEKERKRKENERKERGRGFCRGVCFFNKRPLLQLIGEQGERVRRERRERKERKKGEKEREICLEQEGIWEILLQIFFKSEIG